MCRDVNQPILIYFKVVLKADELCCEGRSSETDTEAALIDLSTKIARIWLSAFTSEISKLKT